MSTLEDREWDAERDARTGCGECGLTLDRCDLTRIPTRRLVTKVWIEDDAELANRGRIMPDDATWVDAP